MMKRRIGLRQAVVIPFTVIVLIVVSTFAILWNYDYERLAQKHSERIAQAMSTLTKDRLEAFLFEPYRLAEVSADYIAGQELYKAENMDEIQRYQKSLYNTFDFSLPQIATISYGDEEGRFSGIRLNSDNTYNLMLQDERTEEKLVIYKGEETDSGILADFDDYDPRIRPWYRQAKSSQEAKWSDVYVNFDEKQQATISALARIYDRANVFQGVICYDISMSGLNGFLAKQLEGSNGLIYIVDKDWNLIVQSREEEETAKKGGQEEELLVNALESSLLPIRESAGYLQGLGELPDTMIHVDIEKEKNFLYISQMKELVGLNWRVVILLPETELMGNMKAKQNFLIAFGFWITVLGCIIGFILVSSFISPISKGVLAASEISKGQYGIHISGKRMWIKETAEFMNAFNKMSDKLKESVERIKHNEEEYSTLIENINNLIFSLSPEGDILSVNRVFEKMKGRGREHFKGKHFSSAFAKEEDIHYFDHMFLKIKEEKECISFPYTFMDVEGERHVYIINFIPLLNSEGELLRILGSTTDITELDKMQKEIKQLHEREKKRLEELVTEKTSELSQAMKEIMEMEKMASLGSLVSGVAHEINTPLGVAVSAASFMENMNHHGNELLQNGQMTKSEFMKYMDSMTETSFILNNNLRKAADLVKNFKQMAVNQSIEEKVGFYMEDFLNTLLINLKHAYKNRGVQFIIECAEKRKIYSYPGAYSQILTNLIMNSLIHAFGDREGVIKITVHTLEKEMILRYSDNGRGIPAENMDKVFDPFFTTNRSGGGSGLGLSIIYNIVTAQLGGKITCESALGSGVVFYIKVPIVTEENEDEERLE
ncbi:MAG: ATP-binding protein [Lacrimispora sp.]|uniref:ATP-binding protein n=1 Tax=Lacrimispora sp. TaxID=2719234 RepID=UPI0039E2BC8F